MVLNSEGGGKRAVEAAGPGVLNDFSGAHSWLHPDYACPVASPVVVGDMAEFHPQLFYPSFTCALLGTLVEADEGGHDYIKIMLGQRTKPWTDIRACEEHMASKADEIKELMAASPLKEFIESNFVNKVEEKMVHLMEALLRDKYTRNADLGRKLVETGTRIIRFEPDYSRTELFVSQYLVDTKRNIVYLDRITAKIRDDLDQFPIRGLFRWLYQQAPVEVDVRRRPHLTAEDPECRDRGRRDETDRQVSLIRQMHTLKTKSDRRTYFPRSLGIEKYHVLDRFPANEREYSYEGGVKRARLGNEGLGGSTSEPSPSLVMGFGKDEDNEVVCSTVSAPLCCVIVPLIRGVFVVCNVSNVQVKLNQTPLLPFVFYQLRPTSGHPHVLILGDDATFHVTNGKMDQRELIRQKRRELEQRLRALGQVELPVGRTARAEGHRILLVGLPRTFGNSDVEAFLNQRSFRFASVDQTADGFLVTFADKTTAWQAKDFFDGRTIRGRTVVARSFDN